MIHAFPIHKTGFPKFISLRHQLKGQRMEYTWNESDTMYGQKSGSSTTELPPYENITWNTLNEHMNGPGIGTWQTAFSGQTWQAVEPVVRAYRVNGHCSHLLSDVTNPSPLVHGSRTLVTTKEPDDNDLALCNSHDGVLKVMNRVALTFPVAMIEN